MNFIQNHIMSNLKNEQAFLVQVLAKNYLENLHKDSNVVTYGEIVNDIDVFENSMNNIKTFEKIFKEHSRPTIETFLNMIDYCSYLESYDVKFAKTIMFKYFFSLLSKMKYPESVQIKLVYISSDESTYKKHVMTDYIIEFEEFRKRFFEMNHEDKYLIVNNMKYLTQCRNYDINESLRLLFAKFDNKTLRVVFKENITDDFLNTFVENLKRFSIEELTLFEITSIPISQNKLLEELGVLVC